MHATACNFLQRRARIRSYKSSSCRKIKLTRLRARRRILAGRRNSYYYDYLGTAGACPSAISVVAPRNSPQLAPCSCSPTQGVRAEFSKALTVAFVSKFPLMVLRTVL